MVYMSLLRICHYCYKQYICYYCYIFYLKSIFISHSWPPVLRFNYSVMPDSETLNIMQYFAMFALTVLLHTISQRNFSIYF